VFRVPASRKGYGVEAMRLPIVTISEGDVDVFETAERLCGYAEPIDVEAGIWRAWDRDGRRLTMDVGIGTYKSLFGRTKKSEVVVVHETPDADPNDPELDQLLHERLAAGPLDPGDRRGSDLLEFVIAHIQPT
jgi:hypothetical protein